MSDGNPTTRDAVRLYFDGKGVQPTHAQTQAWMDAFRGYDPYKLLEAARRALKRERGPPDIQKLQKHYGELKSEEAGGRTHETFSQLDFTADQLHHLRQRLLDAQTPEEMSDRAFGYAREIGKVRQTECDR